MTEGADGPAMEVLVGIVTFGIGLIVGEFRHTWQSRVSADLSSIAELTADISKIEDLAISYWSRPGRVDEDLALEARIHGGLNATRFFEADRICGMYCKRFRELDVQLADAVTGGAFETAEKTVDPSRIATIIEVSHQLRAHLRVVRRAQYWLK